MTKIGIIYWSGSGNTEKMASLIEEGAREAGAEVFCKGVGAALPEDLADCETVVFGSPAMGAEGVEASEMEPFVSSVLPGLRGRKAALFGAYGWGNGEWMRNWAASMRAAGVTLMDEGLTVKEAPDAESADRCAAYGRRLAAF